jgi:hypothetical protein
MEFPLFGSGKSVLLHQQQKSSLRHGQEFATVSSSKWLLPLAMTTTVIEHQHTEASAWVAIIQPHRSAQSHITSLSVLVLPLFLLLLPWAL